MTIVHKHTNIDARTPSERLDQQYRDEGWGSLAEQALGIRPSHVESQARDVARYAAQRIAVLEQACGTSKYGAIEQSAAQTPPHTLDALERAIENAPLTGPAKQKFVNIDARVLAWLIADSRTFAALLAAGAREDSL